MDQVKNTAEILAKIHSIKMSEISDHSICSHWGLDLFRPVSYKENDMHEWVDRSKAWVDSKILNGQKWVFKMYFGQSKPVSYGPKVPTMIKCNIDIYEMLLYA